MKNKNLIMADGIFGLIAGILLLIGPFLITGAALSDVTGGSGNTSGTAGLLLLLRLGALALGILTLIYYKGTNLVKPAAPVLLIVGGGVALIPFLGWAGGIVVIVGGGIAFANLKNFQPKQ
ncbi:hypothetical protein [Lacticaseibacillus kribbianus]|uniref:hypothetical protein n=1 Tax=Lacticaseibacillus kribbianus TaxID=2926292 RepID=UPI001CD4BC60|nr:hypothetical protein [Lacticaseibacillus kribbianus]